MWMESAQGRVCAFAASNPSLNFRISLNYDRRPQAMVIALAIPAALSPRRIPDVLLSRRTCGSQLEISSVLIAAWI